MAQTSTTYQIRVGDVGDGGTERDISWTDRLWVVNNMSEFLYAFADEFEKYTAIQLAFDDWTLVDSENNEYSFYGFDKHTKKTEVAFRVRMASGKKRIDNPFFDID